MSILVHLADILSFPIFHTLPNRGLGECERSGTIECQQGVQVSTCVETTANENERDESCNQQDDDCDGLVDEGYLITGINCPPGSCSETALTICRDK